MLKAAVVLETASVLTGTVIGVYKKSGQFAQAFASSATATAAGLAMRFISIVDPASRAAFVFWKVMRRATPVTLTLTNGVRLQLRARTATENDYGVAYEVFVHRFCDVPDDLLPARDVRLVYDLGANVGFSCLNWLATYANARVVAYEPHPRCIKQCRKNLALNHWDSRVELHAAAAGTSSGKATLSDAGASSQVRDDGRPGLDIAIEDFFARSSTDLIDILKIDIEGGEYALLDDERFSRLSVRVLVLEWHETVRQGRNGAWCRTRLEQMGFRSSIIFENGEQGMLLARHI